MPGQRKSNLALRILLVSCLTFFCARFGSGAEDGPRVPEIEGTVHNLSTTGPGLTRAVELGEICKFCHTPHRGSDVGLNYNKQDTQAPFVFYDSGTMDAATGPPVRESRLCMTCHDGTIALGDLLSESMVWEFPPGHEYLDPSIGGIEPMLRDDHPVSFIYDSGLALDDGELADPNAIGPQLPLFDQRMECSTCHQVHDNVQGYFLRAPWQDGSICESCHLKTDWLTAGHHGVARPASIPPAGADVASGCRSCHSVHFANLDTPLLAISDEEEGCFLCHSAQGEPNNPAAKDMESVFNLPFHHPIELTTGVHQTDEDPNSMLTHVTCADCHNPHSARSGSAMDAMNGVPGITTTGLPIDPALESQQVCYRCHGIDPEPVEDVPRFFSGASIREQFGAGAVSAHPIDRDSNGTPSLRQEWRNVARIECTDCHDSPYAGYPGGPHGSNFNFILERNYRVDGGGNFQMSDAALCDKCHDVAWIIDNDDPFEHKEHFREGVLCGSCHAAHGVFGGSQANSQHLINFDLRVVLPHNGVIEYQTDGSGRGSCTLSCHGEDHDDEDY